MNFRSPFVFDLAAERKRSESKQFCVPRIVLLLNQALEFRRLLDTGAVRSRAELARRSGLSAMRVTQILALQELAPSIVGFIRGLPPGTPERMVTERARRRLTSLEPRMQANSALRIIPGFGSFLRKRAAS